MNAWSQARGGGLLATALARAEAWLLDPPEARGPAPPVELPPRPVVVVRGLARGCGASAVARALAATLARDDPSGTAVLVGGPVGAGPRIAAPAAIRAARACAQAGFQQARASGRVCLVSDADALAAVVDLRAWPAVVDVGHASHPAAGLGYADVAVLVATPEVETALTAAVESSLATAGHRVEVVLNRVEPDALGEAGPLAIGESRLAAQLALACREPRGPLATPIGELAERCRAAAR